MEIADFTGYGLPVIIASNTSLAWATQVLSAFAGCMYSRGRRRFAFKFFPIPENRRMDTGPPPDALHAGTAESFHLTPSAPRR